MGGEWRGRLAREGREWERVGRIERRGIGRNGAERKEESEKKGCKQGSKQVIKQARIEGRGESGELRERKKNGEKGED